MIKSAYTDITTATEPVNGVKCITTTGEEVTLTQDEIATIACYILMTTQYRAREAEAWEKLASERNPDGSTKFPNAPSNARYWYEQNGQLNAILKKLGW